MRIRPYREQDAEATRAIFERAVRQTASAHYTPRQVEAWAPVDWDVAASAAWGAARAAAETVVAVDEETILGFSDLVDGTLLDMLYVDPSAGRRGVGSTLISHIVHLARSRGAEGLETYASITARPVFERHGFVVVEEREPVVRGVAMTNFKMRLNL